MKRMECPLHTGSLTHIYCCTRPIMENGVFHLIKTVQWKIQVIFRGGKKASSYLKNTEENVIEVFNKYIWHCWSFSERDDLVKSRIVLGHRKLGQGVREPRNSSFSSSWLQTFSTKCSKTEPLHPRGGSIWFCPPMGKHCLCVTTS